MAGILNEQLADALGLRNRGVKPKNAEDRGGYLLKNTEAPCVIAEPFFIDNNEDLRTATGKREMLVKAYARGIEKFAKSI